MSMWTRVKCVKCGFLLMHCDCKVSYIEGLMEEEKKEEANMSKCSGECQEIKLRIQDGKYPDGRNKRWVDEHGDLWVGRKCPACVKTGMKGRMAKLRADRKGQE